MKAERQQTHRFNLPFVDFLSATDIGVDAGSIPVAVEEDAVADNVGNTECSCNCLIGLNSKPRSATSATKDLGLMSGIPNSGLRVSVSIATPGVTGWNMLNEGEGGLLRPPRMTVKLLIASIPNEK